MNYFLPKSPETNNYFLDEQTEITDKFLHQTQQQDSVLKRTLRWKKYKNRAITPSLTVRAKSTFTLL